MLKKLLAMLLVIAVMAACVACGTTAETPVASQKEDVTEKQEEKEVQLEEGTPEITVTEQLLVDDENCTVKITGIEEDAIWGYTLKVFLENKTDLELMYSVENVSVNGYMCDPFWASSVTAKMKANEEISFSKDSFEKNGITVPTDIVLSLRVHDSNDWTADALVEQEFVIYPLGEESAQTYLRADQPDDVVLFDNDQCRMIVTGFTMDEIWGYTMNVYLENKSDVEQMFSTDGVAVNGFMCDPYWAKTVAAGKQCNTEITWSEDSFAENGITEVTEIVLPVRVYDSNDWNRDDFVNDTFTVNP